MSQIAVIGHFDFHLEDVERAAELMREVTRATVQEEGCEHYAFSRDLLNPKRFQLSELWTSLAHLDAHVQTPHIAAFRAGLAALRVEQRIVKRYPVEAPSGL